MCGEQIIYFYLLAATTTKKTQTPHTSACLERIITASGLGTNSCTLLSILTKRQKIQLHFQNDRTVSTLKHLGSELVTYFQMQTAKIN